MKEKILHFIEHSKWMWVIVAFAGLTVGLLCQHSCNAQSYTTPSPIVFTQATKVYNAGVATANGEYTISCTFQADTMCGKFVNSGIIFSEFGKNRMYFEYPNFYFVTQFDDHGEVKDHSTTFELVDEICWATLFNNKPHSFIVRRSASKKELLIDSVLIDSYNAPPQAAFTAPIYLSTDRIDYKFSGTISNFNYSPTYQTFTTKPMPRLTIDTLEYPAGYVPFSGDWSKSPDVVTQYNLFPKPVFHKKSKVEYNSLIINMGYLSGYPTLPNAEVAKNAKIISTQIALWFHGGFRVVGNFNQLYDEIIKNSFSVDLAIMDTAKYYPAIPKDIGTACSQTSPIPPLYPMPLQNVTATTPLEQLKPTRDILFKQGQVIRMKLVERGISFDSLRHTENREVMGWMGGGLTGTTIFNTNYNYMLDSMRTLFPHIYTTGYDIYSMWFWNDNGLKYPQVLDMTNTGRSTISIYSEYQKLWKTKKWGEKRGADFRSFSLSAEIAAGHPISTPFISPGWNKDVEANMQISNYSGMLGIYTVMGAAFFNPAFFTISGTGIQDPKGYCHIPVMPAYAQAPISNPEYWDIIMNGAMVPGTTGAIGDYNQWSQRVNIMTVARKLGTKYLIATTHQKENVWNYVEPRKMNVPVTIDGYYIPKDCFFTRPQTTYWYFDSSKKIEPGVNPKHLTGSVFRGWPGYWKTANNLTD